MPKSLKIAALLTFGLAVLFSLFFQISKHDPALSQVNPFGEDPYDAVGSFGVQLALFTAVLALIRAFRPYQTDTKRDSHHVLFARAVFLSCLSVAVTLLADSIAMIRHPTLWIGGAAGDVLAILLGGMVLLTALVLWSLSHACRSLPVRSPLHHWARASMLSSAGILLLALYPEELRQSIGGELLTISVGIAFLFVLVWALGTMISSSLHPSFEDVFDDLAAVYQGLKAHLKPLDTLLHVCENASATLLTLPLVRPLLQWLNPRKHPWHGTLLLGMVIGLLLLLSEMTVEGSPHSLRTLALVAAIFIGVESAGVLLGYALFAKLLGLFRQVSPLKS